MIERNWRHQVQDRKYPDATPALPKKARLTLIGLTNDRANEAPSEKTERRSWGPEKIFRFARNPYVRAIGLGLGSVPAVLVGLAQSHELPPPVVPAADPPGADIIAAADFSPTGQPVLRRGSEGPAVARLQARLTEIGFPSAASPGVFDASLEAAVTAYQTHREIAANGVVGAETWEALAGLNVRNATVSSASPDTSAASAEVETRRANIVSSASWNPAAQPVVEYGARNTAVRQLQERLSRLGYEVGTPDGHFGAKTRAAVVEYQLDQDLPLSRRVTSAMWHRLAAAQPMRAPAPTHTAGGTPIQAVYAPRSAEARALFREAALAAGLPVAWGDSTALHRLLSAESQGTVGIPNYTYGSRRYQEERYREVHAELQLGIRSTRSSATGLGQLLLANVESYYPSGRAGIGDPLEEAIGMLRYIQDRYGSPEAAWNQYNDHHEGY